MNREDGGETMWLEEFIEILDDHYTPDNSPLTATRLKAMLIEALKYKKEKEEAEARGER